MDDRLADSAFVAGPGYSIADITAQITVEFAQWAKLPIPESCPHLTRWFAAVSARPSAKA
jgi:glutathione S-transferase